MADITTLGGIPPVAVAPLNSRANQILKETGLHQAGSAHTENAKIEKSAKDFESILLGNWLQQAEESFGSVPGGDEDDADSGKDQFQSMAMQSMGTAMTAAGGIGIAKMISKQLHKSEEARVAVEAARQTAAAGTEPVGKGLAPKGVPGKAAGER